MRVTTAHRAFLILGLAVVASAPAGAEPIEMPRNGIDPSLVLVSSLDARDELLALERDQGGSSEDGHDPARMFLLSLAVPGTGQLVRGEARGYLYLVAEAAFWTGFFILNGDGLDKRDVYEDYADIRWDYDGYVAFYEESCQECPHCPEQGCRPLADRYSQEFYEDIGKYEAYWDWWIVDPAGGPSTPRGVRDVYWDMRKESNSDLRHARYYVTAAFLNHLVSGVDAFLSSRDGRPSDHSERDTFLEFDVADAGSGLSCAVVMRY